MNIAHTSAIKERASKSLAAHSRDWISSTFSLSRLAPIWLRKSTKHSRQNASRRREKRKPSGGGGGAEEGDKYRGERKNQEKKRACVEIDCGRQSQTTFRPNEQQVRPRKNLFTSAYQVSPLVLTSEPDPFVKYIYMTPYLNDSSDVTISVNISIIDWLTAADRRD